MGRMKGEAPAPGSRVALALGIIALLSFGGMSFFSKPQRFLVYFDESIHGLDAGSPVKLRVRRAGEAEPQRILRERARPTPRRSTRPWRTCAPPHAATTTWFP